MQKKYAARETLYQELEKDAVMWRLMGRSQGEPFKTTTENTARLLSLAAARIRELESKVSVLNAKAKGTGTLEERIRRLEDGQSSRVIEAQ